MTNMNDLKNLGFYEKQTVSYEQDENGNDILSKPIKIYIYFGSNAKASETKNVSFMNSPKNPIWSYGRDIPFGDEKILDEVQVLAYNRFRKEFEGRYNHLNGIKQSLSA